MTLFFGQILTAVGDAPGGGIVSVVELNGKVIAREVVERIAGIARRKGVPL